MSKFYDATKEHKPFDRTAKGNAVKGRHPNKNIKGKNPYSGKTV